MTFIPENQRTKAVQPVHKFSLMLSRNMKKLFLPALLALCFSCKSVQPVSDNSSTGKDPLTAESFSVEATRRILTDLSADEMEGRKPGSRGMEKAAEYIINYLESAEIKPYFTNSYRDTFNVEGTEAYNIVGLLESEKESDDYILLGAHYDHIGKLNSQADSVYNGANDNASGVTAVLEIARLLRDQNLSKNVIVALFSGEESGLLGSAHLAKKLKQEGINLQYVINFEMIGKTLSTGEDKVYITGFNKSDFSGVVNQLLGREFISYLKEEDDYQLFFRSDNYPFYKEFNIPAHTISSFDFKNYKYYHELKDEADQLDVENMNAIIKTSAQAISKLLSENKTIELKEVK